MTRSILRRATFIAPAYLSNEAAGRPLARAPSAALVQASQAQAQIQETIVVVRQAVADVAGTTLPGSDAELEDVVFAADMLADARRDYERPRGHLTSRLTSSARERRVSDVGSVIGIRLARRPFATVQARVTEVVRPGRQVAVAVLNGPDAGLRLTAELGMAFPWDVLV